MKVQCFGCRVTFTIPDDRVPEGKPFRMTCPKCRIPIEIPARDAEHQGLENAAGGSNLSEALADYTNAIDVVEDGVKTALICAAAGRRAETLAQVLQELDFWVVHAARAGFALGKLHHNNYDLLILEENFDSGQAADNLVLHHIQLLPMHLRRQFFLCLLSGTHPSLDAMLAFRMGVNLILNVADLDKSKIILARSLKEYKHFYGFFNAELNRKQA